MKLMVIGVGPGDAAYLTTQARQRIEQAETIFCAPRHEALVPDRETLPLYPFAEAMEQIARKLETGVKTAVLVSGDTGLYSLLPRLTERFGSERLEVYPGISAMQAFCAHMGVSWQDAQIRSAHGRAFRPGALCHTVRTSRRTLLFLDAEHGPAWVRETLDKGGLTEARLIIGERIGYADERVAPYRPGKYDTLCMACVENETAAVRRMSLPEDDVFVRGNVPMTKQEVRTLAAAALEIAQDGIVWDIGAGTGSVSAACAVLCPLGTVYAIEYKEEAQKLIRENAERLGLCNIQVAEGRAPEILKELPNPDHVFIGGSEGCTDEILRELRRRGRTVRIAAAAVTMESAVRLQEQMRMLRRFRAVQVGVSRLEEVGQYTMFKAQNPVFLFSGTLEAEEA